MQFCGTGTGLDIIGSFLIQMIWLDYFQTLSDDQAFAWLCECEAPFYTKASCLLSFPSQASNCDSITCACTVYCITLHYGRSNGGNAGNVKISSSMLSPDIFTADTQHSSLVLCTIPTSLHQTDPFPSGSYCWRWQNSAPLLQWWAHKPT